jgi:hypothetical protein
MATSVRKGSPRSTTGSPPTPPTPAPGDGFGHDADPDRAAATGRQLGQSRAEKLIGLCTTNPGDGTPTPASYVVRLDVETLLRLAPDQAATLLTTMTGGKLWLAADTARRLADTHGTTLRLVIHDHNRVVGVGRKTEKVPGWLAEATLALHDTCTAPGCKVAARVCDTDHASPTAPTGPPTSTTSPPCAPPTTGPKNPTAGTATNTPTAAAPGPTNPPA